MYLWMTLTALPGGSCAHSNSTRSSMAISRLARTKSKPSIARCWFGPRSSSAGPRHARTGPSTLKLTFTRDHVVLRQRKS